jgi:nucleotide-binding universal stress UspA family protein
MISRLLIGYDGSECSDGAVMELARTGLPKTGEAVVASVADVWPHLPPESFREMKPEELAQLPTTTRRAHLLASAAMSEAREIAARGASRVAAALPKWAVRQQVDGGSPPDVLLKIAEQTRAELIHVGSSGRGAVERALLGSTSHKVLAYARCSVRVARGKGCRTAAGEAPDAPRGPVKLIVGVDGSPGSAAAVEAVGKRNWPDGSEALLVGAVDDRITVVPATELAEWAVDWAGAAVAEAQHWVEKVVDAAAGKLAGSGLRIEKRVISGDPKRLLVSEAESWGADCVFVGARGLSRLERFLMGSVASTVASRAPCSVEVVRPFTAAT